MLQRPSLRLLAALSFICTTLSAPNAAAENVALAQANPQVPLSLTQYVRQHWSTADGLPHNSINHISQDHQGYLWLATWEGPVRFNGRSFVVFDDLRTTGFADSAIYTVTRSTEHRQLWFGGGRGSIGYYEQGQWYPQPPLPPFVNDIQPHASNGVWVATNLQGLIWQTKAGERTYFAQAEGLPGHSVFEVSYDRYGHLWVATNQGLAVQAAGAQRFVAVGGLPSALVQALLVARTGEVWVAIGNTLYRGDLATGFQPYFSALPHSFTTLFEAADGAIWFGSHTHGVGRFYPSQSANIDYLGQEHGLANNHVLDIFQDNEGSMWIGTHGGLTQLRQALFQSYGEHDGLRGDYVRAITSSTTSTADRRHTSVWVGTSAGVTRLVVDKHTQRQLDVLELAQGSVLSLAVHPAGYLLVGTYTKGLLAFKLDAAGEHEISAIFSTENVLKSNEVRQLEVLPDGTIFVGTAGGLTRILNPFEQPVATHLGIPQGLPNQYITALHHDPFGNPHELWVGTVAGLVHIPDARTQIHDFTKVDLAKLIRARDSAVLGLPELIFAIDHNQLGIWIATDRGLLFMPRNAADNSDIPERKIYLFNRDTGLPTDKFFSVKALPTQVWLGGSTGAIKLPLQQLNDHLNALQTQQELSQTYQHFGPPDGFNSHQLNSGGPAIHLTDEQELWFATANGVTRIALSEVEENYQQAPPPRPLIESAFINHRPMAMDAKLAADAGRVDFTFVGLGYQNPAQIRYQVRLLGFQDQWEPRGRLGYVEYTALPAGTYQFQVRAAYPGGGWSEPATFNFSKQAGVTSHWLFWLIIAATLTGVGYLSVAWRLKALANAKTRLSELVAEQTHELNQLAREDALTHLANRRAFDERLQQELERAQRYPRSLCLAIIDIDYFKAVNDEYLHDVGDHVLQQVGAALKTAVRDVDFVARWGGEEFAVLFPDTDLTAAQLVCERIRAQIAALEFPQPKLKITVSIGLADNMGTNDRRLLVKLADQALYAAKHQGRNQVCTGKR